MLHLRQYSSARLIAEERNRIMLALNDVLYSTSSPISYLKLFLLLCDDVRNGLK